MIPRAYIQGWSAKAPWPDLRQVEQDLIICRALCDLFNASALKGKIAFRGGTAIHKLVFEQPLRLSRVAGVYWRAPCLLSDGGETRDMIEENPSPSIVHENHALGAAVYPGIRAPMVSFCST